MVNVPQAPASVRLSEVVCSLSLVTDLATGQRLEHGLRRTALAVWLGESLGLSPHDLSTAYFVALLGTVGCTLEMATLAPTVRDEIAIGEELSVLDPTSSRQMGGFFLRYAGAGDPPLRRLRKLASTARSGPALFQNICRDVSMRVGDMIQIGEEVRQALGKCHERWDGLGGPQHLKGEDVDIAVRVFHVVHDADIFNMLGGIEAVHVCLRQRSGKQYDPAVANRFQELADDLLGRLEAQAAWDEVVAMEPAPVRWLTQDQLDEMTKAIANFIDLRSSFTLGHSVGVAELAEAAARSLGLSDREAVEVRRAGLLHDLGRAGVPVAVWEKEGPLTEEEWDRVKRHPSLTELVLARSNALGHLGALAGQHHEREDGSGYRSSPASFLSTGARVLAAADTYQTKIEPRPHRDALTAEEAGREVARLAREGLFDKDVAAAVLEAAGQPRLERTKPALPAGLSEREVEVLRLAVHGLSNRQMAEALFVSPKTVGHHIQHIYSKIGVSTRVGATLFALQHGLLDEQPAR